LPVQQHFRQVEALAGFESKLARGCGPGGKRPELHITFERVKDWLLSCEAKVDLWPKLKSKFAEHEWVIYPFFVLLVVIFFLLLPRAARFP
jgi:hypothetical protein